MTNEWDKLEIQYPTRVCQFHGQQISARPPLNTACYVFCNTNLQPIAKCRMCYRLQELPRKQETLLNKANRLESLQEDRTKESSCQNFTATKKYDVLKFKKTSKKK